MDVLTKVFSSLICSAMIVYFFIIIVLPFAGNNVNGCIANYMKYRDWYDYTQYPDGFYANTFICFIGWVSYLM